MPLMLSLASSKRKSRSAASLRIHPRPATIGDGLQPASLVFVRRLSPRDREALLGAIANLSLAELLQSFFRRTRSAFLQGSPGQKRGSYV
jgi:hypothetical protein